MAGKKTNLDELSELDNAYQKIAPKKKKTKAKVAVAMSTSAIVICITAIVLILAVLLGVFILFGDNWIPMGDVTIAGINMSGMSMREAKNKLAQMEKELYTVQPMRITVLDTTVEFSAADAGIQINETGAVFGSLGKSGEFDLTPYISLNEEALRAIVDEFGVQFNADLTETTISVEGTMPALDSSTPQEGTGQTLILQLGTPQLGLDTDALYRTVMEGYSNGNFDVTGECSVLPPEMPTADSLYEKYMTAPVDAVMDPKTFVITPETYGYSVDPVQAAAMLENAKYGDLLRIPFAIVVPENTEESILATLFQDVLGECSTPYSGDDNNNRNTNLRLACEKVDGVIILPGEIFSYNMTLGERTKANGWKPAASYVNGLTVDTYGGGICQGSTTLYNCVLQADFELVECWPHGYVSAYVPHGLDASVNWGTADFRFKNTSNYPIKIEAYRRDGKMTMRIYGTDEKDYYIEMSYKDISYRSYKTVYEEIDPANNPKGYRDGQVLVTPYTGLRVQTFKNKYSKATGELIETTLERDFTYSHRDQVIVKFVTPTPTPPEETEGTE